MIKNYLLWIAFCILLVVTSATACLAGQESVQQQKNGTTATTCCLQSEENLKQEGKESVKDIPVNKETKDEETREISPSILNSNFIFYIIYKFKFIDVKSYYKVENEDKATLPIISYTGSFYIAISSLFENKF